MNAEASTAARIEVRRNPLLVTPVAALAALVSVAYLWRAVDLGWTSAWLLFAITGLIAVGFLALVVDCRQPLLVLDDDGARIRLRRGWRTLTWESIGSAVIAPRRNPWTDGRLTVTAIDGERYQVPLGLITGVTEEQEVALTRQVELLAGGRAEVATVTVCAPGPATRPAPQPTKGSTAKTLSSSWGRGVSAVSSRLGGAGGVGGTTQRPTTGAVVGANALATQAMPATSSGHLPEERYLRREIAFDLDLDPEIDDEPVVILRSVPAEPTELAVSGGSSEADAAPEMVGSIGACLSEARQRVGLSVDELADRTRIRPHVLECIEIDDFGPCGGDVYARGHLGALAHLLGEDADALLARFEQSHATGQISARRVFEAELGAGATSSLRGTSAGSGWMLLMGVVLALVLVWAVLSAFVSSAAPDSPIPTIPGEARQ